MSSLPLPIAAFVAGLISFLSPCVLPLIPGYVSLISGTGVGELKQPDARLLCSVMRNSIMFIAGFTLVFITLGAVASSLGQLVSEHIGLLTKIAGAIIIVFGFHLTGLLPIRWLYADKRLHRISGGSTPAGSFLVGFSFAFGWAPCIGPILAAVLALAATESTLTKGSVLPLRKVSGKATNTTALVRSTPTPLCSPSPETTKLRGMKSLSGANTSN